MLKKRKLILLLCTAVAAQSNAAAVMDSIEFGNGESEAAHGLKSELSQEIKGELDQPARRLLPTEDKGWRGGRVTFNLAVDPDNPNYFTVKLWGGETSTNDVESRLCLFIDGKQVGQRHLGEIDFLDIMDHNPRYPGRFFYKTLPLPENMTKGKTSVELAIEGQGGINGYASKIEDYQKMMTEPSRAIYRGYVHTQPCLVPGADDVQGSAPVDIPVRPEPGPEVIEELKQELNKRSDSMMEKAGSHVDNLQYLAYAYCTPWNTAHKNPKALEAIVAGLDKQYCDWRDDPDTLVGVRWVHKGPAGDAVRLVIEDLKPFLNKPVEGKKTRRREAWGDLFIASRDYGAERRRSYSNQSMITDVNTYCCNLAASLLGSSKAWPEKTARLLLYESMGIEPWSGNWDERAKADWSQGRSKYLFTEMGLTRELGFVGAYGEIVADSGKQMYEATKPSPDAEGDPRVKKQLIKLMRARAPFRYPLIDQDGCRSMNLEAIIGWRDWHYPGGVLYGQMNGRDGGAFDVAVSTKDPVLMGYGQQMLDDNQFFAKVKDRMEDRRTSSKTWLLAVPGNYEKIMALPPMGTRLPMTKEQPDFVFADTTDGVIALKNGDEILYVSLYWRARSAINNLARVHYLTPVMERDATVHIETRFNDSGETFTIPDWTNMGFARGRAEDWYEQEGMHLAEAGKKQPIAVVPDDYEHYEVGDENPYAGKGDLYLMNYGRYYIAMNCTEQQSFDFDLPDAFVGAKDLVSGQTCNVSQVPIRPTQTIVFYRNP